MATVHCATSSSASDPVLISCKFSSKHIVYWTLISGASIPTCLSGQSASFKWTKDSENPRACWDSALVQISETSVVTFENKLESC